VDIEVVLGDIDANEGALHGVGPPSEKKTKPTTFLFKLVNAECVQVTIRTKESRDEADPNFGPDSKGPSVKRSRPHLGFGIPQPVLEKA
jgi:hypothetical protein